MTHSVVIIVGSYIPLIILYKSIISPRYCLYFSVRGLTAFNLSQYMLYLINSRISFVALMIVVSFRYCVSLLQPISICSREVSINWLTFWIYRPSLLKPVRCRLHAVPEVTIVLKSQTGKCGTLSGTLNFSSVLLVGLAV